VSECNLIRHITGHLSRKTFSQQSAATALTIKVTISKRKYAKTPKYEKTNQMHLDMKKHAKTQDYSERIARMCTYDGAPLI